MQLELKPYLNGEWQLLTVIKEYIDVTTKDHNGQPSYITINTEAVFIGSLQECTKLLEANNKK